MPGWQGENLQKILSVALFVYDGHEEQQKAEQIKEREKAKDQEANFLAMALARFLPGRNRGRGGRRPAGTYYGPESLCHRLGSQDVTTLLNTSIVFAFTASVYLQTAFSAATSLSLLPPSRCPCHRSWRFPELLCALLWALSFLLTFTLYFCPAALSVFILSYLLSVLTLVLSGLTLLARVLCSSWQCPPRTLCVVVLLAVVFFPFFTADFCYWLLLRLFDFSVFVFNASLPLACVNSTINPVIYFLAGSCAEKFTLSVRVAFERTFEDLTEPQNRGETPRENTVEAAV
ncbi:proto-oncogene Mas-like [Chroicocephalus ridibundus]|uniref:proto-oncogene Mas-like n=1 Tax=Chroicocephalus ridibundus TaxID=1192867 RepID=UPI002FDD84C4